MARAETPAFDPHREPVGGGRALTAEMDQLYGLGLLVAWVLLQAWILPKLGVST